FRAPLQPGAPESERQYTIFTGPCGTASVVQAPNSDARRVIKTQKKTSFFLISSPYHRLDLLIDEQKGAFLLFD
ncbi:MAG: hypothetical protein AB9888_05000, partial [Bacteroidales bacterium]